VKQCPNCRNNLADYVPFCPFCGVSFGVARTGTAQPMTAGPQESSGKATASLICGILFIFPPVALAAIILGHLALSDIKRSVGRLAGRGMAIAGLALGYVGIAFVPLVLIIAAIAIPNLLRARMAANEASAVGALRTYNTAMVTYAAECPSAGYPKSLASLGQATSSQDPCQHAQLVDTQLAQQFPIRRGYRFYFASQSDTGGPRETYILAADPITPGKTGVRHFFTDQTGVIRFSARGAADANSEPLQ